MLEMTADSVSECVGINIPGEEFVEQKYETLCDPRLNPTQANELVVKLGQTICSLPNRVALILAKSGSIRLPGKNTEYFKGETFVGRGIRLCKESGIFDGGIFVSTNCLKVAQIAKELHAQVIMRDDILAQNDQYIDAVNHAVKKISEYHAPNKAINGAVNSVTIVQCVQPFIEKDILKRTIDLLDDNRLDSVVTVSPGPGRLEWLFRPMKECTSNDYFDGFKVYPIRSTLPKQAQGRSSDLFEIDNAVVTFSWKSWKQQNSRTPWPYLGERIYGIVQDRNNKNFKCDIDYPDDLEWSYYVSGFPEWQISRWDSGMFSDNLDYLGYRNQVFAPTLTNRPDLKFYGRARTVHIVTEETNDENISMGLGFLETLSEGDVLIVDGSMEYSYFGELMTRLSIRQRLAGVVIGGLTRDNTYTRSASLPIHALGFSPKDIKGRGRVHSVDVPIELKYHISEYSKKISVNPGDYIFGDADGVVIIPTNVTRQTINLVKKSAHSESDIKRRINNNESVNTILSGHNAF